MGQLVSHYLNYFKHLNYFNRHDANSSQTNFLDIGKLTKKIHHHFQLKKGRVKVNELTKSTSSLWSRFQGCNTQRERLVERFLRWKNGNIFVRLQVGPSRKEKTNERKKSGQSDILEETRRHEYIVHMGWGGRPRMRAGTQQTHNRLWMADYMAHRNMCRFSSGCFYIFRKIRYKVIS